MRRLLNQWWNRRYPEWVPEVALRYLPIVESMRKTPVQGMTLEVGINQSGLTRYLERPVVGVDRISGAVPSALVTPVVAEGQALPFRTAAFDSTVCMDTLEHVEPSQRHLFLSELMRVTARRLYIGCPMGSGAEQEDRELQAYYRAQKGESFSYLDEHVAHGLPRLEPVLDELRALAREAGTTLRLRAEPNLNLGVHRVLLRLWINTDSVSYLLHRLAILLIHVRRWLNYGTCYRQIIVADFERQDE